MVGRFNVREGAGDEDWSVWDNAANGTRGGRNGRHCIGCSFRHRLTTAISAGQGSIAYSAADPVSVSDRGLRNRFNDVALNATCVPIRPPRAVLVDSASQRDTDTRAVTQA
jgi:hypothetical protein